MSTSDCGCWTDSEGYWRLSDACRAAELHVWENMLRRHDESLKEQAKLRIDKSGTTDVDIYYVNNESIEDRVAKEIKRKAAQYFRQELGKNDVE